MTGGRAVSTRVKLVGFVAVLALVLLGGLAIGNAVGPIGDDEDGAEPVHLAAPEGDAGHSHDEGGDSQPGGLMVADRGYKLDLDSAILDRGRTEVAFRVLGPDREPVTDYEEIHEKDLHFIAVRRDLTGFQHVHPRMAGDGTWRTELDLTPGGWRFFADFKPSGLGEEITLGADASVAGDYRPRLLPTLTQSSRVGAYTITLKGSLRAGEGRELTLTVEKDGRPVTDLEPYLAAYGHLVALRVGDLAYLHVHPDGEPGDGTPAGPEITFHATAPSAGDYRLFLDFKHEGVVRTAEFTARATGTTPADAPSDTEADDGHDH